MTHYLAAGGGFVLGVLGTLGYGAVWEMWARLDRIEQYLTRVSQMLRG